MNCVIFGSAKSGKWLEYVLKQKKSNINIKYFCDNNSKLHGKYIDGVEIISPDKLGEYYSKREFECVIIAMGNIHLKDVTYDLLKLGIYNVYIVPKYMYRKSLDGIELNELLYKIDITKPRLRYYEYHVIDSCNLNCKGCGHLCNLINYSKDTFGNLDSYINDIRRIKELVWGVERIRLMGGEPLLNPHLGEFIKVSRNMFPDTDLKVVTNGLLIPKLDKETLEIMRDYNCEFDISLYEPTEKIIDEIKNICDLYGIVCNISPLIKKFSRRLTLNKSKDGSNGYGKCSSMACHYLKDGKMSTCVIPQIIHIFNERYNTNITADESDIIDIYDETLDGWKMVERLSKSMSICDYCSEDVEDFTWRTVGSKAKMTDWIID